MYRTAYTHIISVLQYYLWVQIFLLFTFYIAKGKKQKSTSLILSIIQSTIGQYGAIKKLRKKKKLRLVFTKNDLLAF